ncbi:unnamed protein product [Phytomonas sp. EM1]|nr:unnamed protein product [Phytomonas sp. EM1]|eukprot:CCW64745.1 unnamed protein product [Phytomonas sp. isolate EM1]
MYLRYLRVVMGGIPNLGKTCSFSAVEDIVTRLPQAGTIPAKLMRAVYNPTIETARALADYLEVSGPVAPLGVVVKMIEGSRDIAADFTGYKTSAHRCKICGKARDANEKPPQWST